MSESTGEAVIDSTRYESDKRGKNVSVEVDEDTIPKGGRRIKDSFIVGDFGIASRKSPCIDSSGKGDGRRGRATHQGR